MASKLFRERRGPGFKFGIVIVAVLFVFVSMSYYRMRSNELHSNAISGIEINNADLDFGHVWEEEAFLRDLDLRNRSSTDISVQQFLFSRRGVRIVPERVTVPAKGSAKVRIVANLINECGCDEEAEIRPYSCRISALINNTIDNQHSWELKGKVRSIMHTPSLIRFDKIIVGQFLPAVYVKIRINKPNTQLNIKQPNAVCKVAETMSFDPHSLSYTIMLRPKDDLPIGWLENVLEVEALQEGVGVLMTKRIPIDGRVECPIRAVPDSIEVGVMKCGSESVFTITMAQSGAKQDYEILSLELPENLSIEAVEGSEERQQLKLRYKMCRLGHIDDAIKIRARAVGGIENTVAAHIYGYGLSK